MLKTLYDKTLQLSGHRHARWALAGVSFVESSVFPVPPDALLIPMVLARRTAWFQIALICTISSVLGGLFGYAIGYFAWEAIGQPVIEMYGKTEQFTQFQEGFNANGWLWVFGAGLTPFPYKVITLTAGLTALNLPLFILASVFARGLRFFLVAFLLYRFGEPVMEFIEKRLALVTIVLFVAAVGIYLLLHNLL